MSCRHRLLIPTPVIAVFLAALTPLASATAELKFNCGGFALSDYAADPVAFLSGDEARYRYSGTPPDTLTVGISHRWGSDKGFSYDFPLGNGAYDIDLIFAEIYPPAQRNYRRRFDVFIEDKLVIDDLDVFDVVGADVEYTSKHENQVVNDGMLSIAFRKGSIENPMISAIRVRASNGSDISLGKFTQPAGEGDDKPSSTGVWDHQAHAVAGGPYRGTDYNGNGRSIVFIDGRRSHSHYSNPETGESGRVVKYEWRIGNSIISRSNIFSYPFEVGVTALDLLVEDQTGDRATATTEINVLPATASGAYCYYYNGSTSISDNLLDPTGAMPDEGHSTNVINFFGRRFVYGRLRRDDGSPNEWAVRCVTNFQSRNTTDYSFSVRYRGGGAKLYVNNGLKAQGGDSNGDLNIISANVIISDTTVPMQVVYYSGGAENPEFMLMERKRVVKANELSYKTAFVIPTVSSISSTELQPQGGSQLQIVGTGFFNNVSVSIGNAHGIKHTLISPTLIQISSAPSMQMATGVSEADAVNQNVEAEVYVSNNAASSNKLRISYTNNARKGINWEQTVLKQNTAAAKMFVMKQITAIKIGPDSKYYTGTYGGFVSRLDIGKDLKVISKCDSDRLGPRRAILGLAFNYASPLIRLYVSTNTLYIRAYNKEGQWANGAIETFVHRTVKSCSKCLCYERKVITGLPVSGHDHGVNGLLFLANGDLLISVGGATNMGVPSKRLGLVYETPLSGAILLATLSKGDSFDGTITYDNYTHGYVAKQTGGFDVSVYASGLRNCFALTQHLNGQIWATDNGPNRKFGPASVGCGEDDEVDENTLPSIRVKDEVNLIQRGSFYGHPNRNRGQCVHDGTGTVKPKLRIQSATTGIVEYTSNAFSGALQGQMVLSKYAASGDGRTWRISIERNNDEVSLSRAIPMSFTSGVVVENGLHGELFMPKVQKGFVAVLKPIYKYDGGSGVPFVIAVSPNRGRSGHRVLVTGEGFMPEGSSNTSVQVKFGALDAYEVVVLDHHSLTCRAPVSGAGVVEIDVIVAGLSSGDGSGGGGSVRFVYL